MDTIELKENERIDILKNGNKIIQDDKRFCFGIDAVLLADFADTRKNNVVVDLCTGTGIVPLLMESKTNAFKFYGIEIQQDSWSMANRSVQLNGLENKIEMLNCDIKEIDKCFARSSVDVVTTNPPYMIAGHGKQNPNDYKSIARHEVLCNLEDVVKAADYLLKSNGVFYLIHRPFRLAEIFSVLMKYNLEPKRMQLVYPFVDKEPNMVLIEARKNANSRITIDKPLIVREKSGEYTADIQKIYSH